MNDCRLCFKETTNKELCDECKELDTSSGITAPTHIEYPGGYWVCEVVGKNDVKVSTTRQGFKACGHCISYVLDSEGNKQPWTMIDQLLSREKNNE